MKRLNLIQISGVLLVAALVTLFNACGEVGFYGVEESQSKFTIGEDDTVAVIDIDTPAENNERPPVVVPPQEEEPPANDEPDVEEPRNNDEGSYETGCGTAIQGVYVEFVGAATNGNKPLTLNWAGSVVNVLDPEVPAIVSHDNPQPIRNVNQVRLIVGQNNYVVDADGNRIYLKSPSGQQTGIKLSIPKTDFDAEPEAYVIRCDIDPGFQIVGTPNKCIFKPVVHNCRATRASDEF